MKSVKDLTKKCVHGQQKAGGELSKAQRGAPVPPDVRYRNYRRWMTAMVGPSLTCWVCAITRGSRETQIRRRGRAASDASHAKAGPMPALPLGVLDTDTALPTEVLPCLLLLCREVSRQEYLKKREKTKLDELR
jgi:hypothetical protein